MSATASYNFTNNRTIIISACNNYQGSLILAIESCILLALAIGSQVLNYVLLPVLLRSGGHLPVNTKILLINCTVANVVKGFYFFLRSIYNFCLLQLGFGALAIERKFCAIIEIPYGVVTMVLHLSMISIGFERLWATWKKNLAQTDKIGWKLVSALVVIWILSISIYTINMTVGEKEWGKKMCYCYYPMLLQSGVANNVIIIGTQTTNMIIYFIVYWKNKKLLFEFTLNAARHNLSERFIMWSNVKTTKMLIPASISHAVTYDIVLMSMQVVKAIFPDITNDMSLCVSIFTIILLCLDTLLHPIFCLQHNEALRDIAVKFYPKLRYIVGSSTIEGEKTRCTKTTDTKIETKENDQNKANPKAKRYQTQTSTGIKKIIEFRVKPDQNQDILNQMWTMTAKRNFHKNAVKPA